MTQIPEHFQKLRNERARTYSDGTSIAVGNFLVGYDACFSDLMPMLEMAMEALELSRKCMREKSNMIQAIEINEQTLTTLKQKLGKGAVKDALKK